MIYAGVDEINKGEVLNPIIIVIAYTSTNITEIPYLKDSKRSTLKEQEVLGFLEKYKISYKYLEIGPVIKKGSLNKKILEAQERLISWVNPDHVYVDSLESNTLKLREFFAKTYSKTLDIESKLDESNTLVSVASLIGKVIKKRNLEKLESEVKMKVGSGNLRDPLTINYIKRNYPKVKGLKTTWSLKSIKGL